MLARRLPGILPPLTLDEAVEVTTLASVAGLTIGSGLITRRPFRAPHHSTTAAGLVGGGAPLPRPGELSLAHHGVLFLDELPEFPRHTLEVLREPIASGVVELSRAAGTIRYQGNAQIVAASNPCSCGMLGHPRLRCRCSRDDVARYQRRLNDGLGDVFAIRKQVPAVDFQKLAEAAPGEPTAVIRARVVQARQRQLDRAGKLNAALTTRELQAMGIDDAGKALIQSALSCGRIRQQKALLAVARTIADLAGEELVSSAHLAEALSLQ
jgi:magnesium chelatase family protein